MPILTSQNQCSFVPRHHIFDNIVIYQEVLHTMRIKSRGKGIMLIKIDLEKAYDRLECNFIKDILQKVGLPNDWIRNVMDCLETVKMSIMWKGKNLKWFRPIKGIHQGDVISPYLCVLCMERLGHINGQAVRERRWTPISVSHHGPPLSHLFFADDLLLFAEASENQINAIMGCLEKFCSISG